MLHFISALNVISRAKNFYIVSACTAFILSISIPARADDVANQGAAIVQSAPTVTKRIIMPVSELAQFGGDFPYQTYFKDDEQLVWQMTMPNRPSDDSPLGVLVYISPMPSGSIPEEWKRVLVEKNLIWISADMAGNDVKAQRRVIQALLAVQLVYRFHSVNKLRIYIAGFSGGGRVASMMAPLYPTLFRGGIFMGGANELKFTPQELVNMQKNHYVFINGDADFNLAESKKIFKKLKAGGVSQVAFFEVPKLAHSWPPAEWLALAIDSLDGNDVIELPIFK